jgi:hypothetical protein
MVESERHLITAAPGQNLNTGQSIERYIPLLAADSLNKIREYATGKPIPAIDMWNNCGQKMDIAHAEAGKDESRYDYATRLLAEKYAVLAQLGIDVDSRTIIRDDSSDVQVWLTDKLKQLYKDKILYEAETTFNACGDCGYLISERGAPVSKCSGCGSQSFVGTEARGLFIDLPSNKHDLLNGKVYIPKNQKHLQGIMETLPDRTLVSRVREYGLPLDFLGFDGFVLDPKIGISLMPGMVAETHGLDEITQIQGIRTAMHTAPFTTILSPNHLNTYAFLYRIPPTTLETAQNLGIDFVSHYLPLFLFTKKGDIGKGEVENLKVEFGKVVRKIDNTMKVLSRDEEFTRPLSDVDRQKVTEVVSLLLNYDISQGLSSLRGFIYDTLSAGCANEFKQENAKLSDDDIAVIEGMLKIVY